MKATCFLVFLLLKLFTAQAQTCPGSSFEILCGSTIPFDAWTSNITGERLSDGSSSVSFSWDPDPTIPLQQNAYRIATRNMDVDGSQYVLSRRVDASQDFTMELEFSTRYEALVCYNDITVNRLERNSDFIRDCGYCRTCFRTRNQSPFITITSATMSTLTNSDMILDVYMCEASGSPLPLTLTWRAERVSTSTQETLSSDTPNVNISLSMQGNEISSALTLIRNGEFDSPVCRVVNRNGADRTEDKFQDLDSNSVRTKASSVSTPADSQTTVEIPVFAIVLLSLLPAVAVPFVIIASILAYKCYYRHRKHQKMGRNSLAMISVEDQDNPNKAVDAETVEDKCNVSVLRQILPKKLFIPPSNLNVSLVIGQGEFGVIYKACLKDENTERTVAVKTLKGIFVTTSDIHQATDEILKMSYFDHLNVISLVGVCVAPSDESRSSVGPSIVMPFMEKGCLLDFLRREADNLHASNDDEVLKVRKPLIQICQQIARGMNYLASLKFVHRDLAARNCLIDSEGVIKVSDFGLTESVYTQNYFRQAKDGAKLPLKWMALESIKLGIFTEKTDVWSYGVTCWEVFTGGAIPYPGVHPREVLGILEEGERLPKPKNQACCSEMYALMLSCWKEAERRPTFLQILMQLEDFLAATAEYVDFTDSVSSCHGHPHQQSSLYNRIPAPPNDYSIADFN